MVVTMTYNDGPGDLHRYSPGLIALCVLGIVFIVGVFIGGGLALWLMR